MKINDVIMKVSVDLQKMNLPKSGKNRHAGFAYYELKDFLPSLNVLMLDNKLSTAFTIEEKHAQLIIFCGEEKQIYKMPFKFFEVPKTKNGGQIMQEVQYLGAENTYYKRYLYLNAFSITDGEVIDNLNASEFKATVVKAPTMEELRAKAQANLTKFIFDNKLNMKEISAKNGLSKQTTTEELDYVLTELQAEAQAKTKKEQEAFFLKQQQGK